MQSPVAHPSSCCRRSRRTGASGSLMPISFRFQVFLWCLCSMSILGTCAFRRDRANQSPSGGGQHTPKRTATYPYEKGNTPARERQHTKCTSGKAENAS